MDSKSFPKDLQQHLASLFPAHLRVQSSLYPTYKSKKPISFATHNFLQWLSTQPPGPVILMAHSMGGLLAADAATDTSDKHHRIMGMIAFDTPYLGMHPHVVISGIASLFPKDNENKNDKPTEHELNHPHVVMVDEGVTDDWSAYKKTIPKHEGSMSSLSLASSQARPGPFSPSPSVQSQSTLSSSTSPGGSSMDPNFLVDKALSHPFISGSLKFMSSVSDDPLVKWARKHSDAPFAAGRTWITEHFQFGSSMFDVSDLKQRYARLVAWDGLWVNYWTETLPRKKVGKEGKEDEAAAAGGELDDKAREMGDRENDAALLETGIAEPADTAYATAPSSPTSPTPPTPSDIKAAQKAAQKLEKARLKEEKAAEKAAKKDAKKGIIPPRHFIVLPTGLGRALGGSEKWEPVIIAGVQDEVAAHCGLFIRDQNLDYDGLVERVGVRVLKWCETIR
ncbi:hypothetical protein FIBSPDRAFT_934031 [Athelia psychrophila]|uniref:Uncharacterized protein n=1 Tax=Athelia psychrophila TaxID=1759441 RepID=A0A166FZM5_9AGAM|nr:hypothetical protein FIBSPDRAFT_934031 [Fibularhizoctonia sp. CBS 109695]